MAPAALGVTRVDWVEASPSSGYVFSYDYATNRLRAFRTGAINSPAEEVPNATNLAAVTTRVVAIGI